MSNADMGKKDGHLYVHMKLSLKNESKIFSDIQIKGIYHIQTITKILLYHLPI